MLSITVSVTRLLISGNHYKWCLNFKLQQELACQFQCWNLLVTLNWLKKSDAIDVKLMVLFLKKKKIFYPLGFSVISFFINHFSSIFQHLALKFGLGKENVHLLKKNHLPVLQLYLKFQDDIEKNYVKNSILLDFYPTLPSGSTVTWRGAQCLKLQTFFYSFSTTGKC